MISSVLNAQLCVHIDIAAAADEGALLIERHVSAEQAVADLAVIRGMWQMAAIIEFLAQFRHYLGFTQIYPVTDLEDALASSAGPGGCCHDVNAVYVTMKFCRCTCESS